MYFENFPKIAYSFSIAGSDKLLVLKDITLNPRVRKAVLSSLTLFDEYDLEEGETPEKLANKVYGNPNLHWVIMLTNERFDLVEDFPMSSYQLEMYTRQKYPGEISSIAITTAGTGYGSAPTISIPAPDLDWGVQATATATITGGAITAVTITNKGSGYTSVPTITLSGGSPSAAGVLTASVSANPSSQYQFHGSPLYKTPDGYIVDSDHPFAEAVSNQDYELDLNESKRRIKLINPQMVDKLSTELSNIFRDEEFG